MIVLLIVIVISYLLGSIPTSIIVGKILRGIDIREHGSGNAGGTNVFRVLGWKPALFVAFVDILKGFAATFWVAQLAFGALALEQQTIQLIAGCAAVFGHVWTIFAGFRGGKGVGTAAGMLMALYPFSLLICFAVFVLVFLVTRIVSVSSMIGAITLPVILSLFRYAMNRPVVDSLYYFSFFAACLIVFTHRSNIRRLINGTENRFVRRKDKR